MFCSCLVLSFDACIVTITWFLLFVVIALWVCFLVFHRLTRKHLALVTNVVFGYKSFGEAPRLARKYGTHMSDSPVRAL
jgi:hypothetical protein